MKTKSFVFAVCTVLLPVLLPGALYAHCDGLDGPVVNAARRSLAENNLNVALVWVQKGDEPELKRAFEQTRAVRQLGAAAKDLADRYFFETLVRLHRAGEGAPYTGLKPAGRDLGPAIPAGDDALATGKIEPLLQLLSEGVKHRLLTAFEAARTKRRFAPNDVAAGREYVQAYVKYIHLVEAVHQAVTGGAHGHPGESDSSGGHASPAHDDPNSRRH